MDQSEGFSIRGFCLINELTPRYVDKARCFLENTKELNFTPHFIILIKIWKRKFCRQMIFYRQVSNCIS